MTKKRKPLSLVLLVALGSCAGSAVLAQQPHKTLRDRAKGKGGGVVWRYRASRSLIYPNIEELAKRSDLILVGRTLGHRTALRGDGKFLTNDFLVRVQSVLKGEVAGGSSVLISVPGGAYAFPDGNYAALLPANFKEAEDGHVYIFFLKAKQQKSAFKGHTLVSETQGLFELKDGKIEPADYASSDPIVKKYRGLEAPKFLTKIRAAVPRKAK